MSVHFYLADCGGPAAEPVDSNLQVHCWRPREDGFPPRQWRNFSNILCWAIDHLGGFGRPGFAAVGIARHGRLVHRLIVTPAWYRFPFMAPEDLQIGAVWTSPDARRQQLAATTIAEAHRRFGGQGTRFWYVAEADNVASGALARACGYRLVATGRRTRRLGISLLGQFVVDRWVQRERMATQAIDPDCSDESGAGRTRSVSH